MHFYKRDLTPLREQYAQNNEKTPYKANFQNYDGSLMGKSFKEELLNNLGGDIRCQSSSFLGRRISTFLLTQKQPKRNNSATQAFRPFTSNAESE